MALYSFMMDYIPYQQGSDYDSQTLVFLKSGNIYSKSRKEKFYSRIKGWLMEEALRGVDTSAAIIVALAPGHTAESSHGFLNEVIAEVVQTTPRVQDGRNLLRRTTTVQKATEGGPRDVDLHMQTIQVTNPELVAGRVVCILDDVWTTGATLTACERLMVSAGASKVRLLAVAKTKHYQET